MILNYYRELKLSRKKSTLSHFKNDKRATGDSRPKVIQLCEILKRKLFMR